MIKLDYNNVSDKTKQRFYNKIDIPDNKEDCWLWKASKITSGYGAFGCYHKLYTAHRFSLFMHLKHWGTNGQVATHKCDNRKCVNPYHLKFDTQKSNMQEKIERGRQPKKYKKINADIIELIKNKYIENNNITYAQLSRDYNVDVQTVRRLIKKIENDKKTNENINNLINLIDNTIIN